MALPTTDPARAPWYASNAASILAVLVLLGAVLTLGLRGELLAEGAVGLAVQAAAFLLMVWARVTFGLRSFHAGASPTSGGLVTSGPYHFVRHPIYAAILLFIWTAVATNLSVVSVALGAIITAATTVRIASEERLVIERYPEYAAYAKTTRRIVPYVL